MTTKLSKRQLHSKLADIARTIEGRFANVGVEYHDQFELWGADHARLEQRGFPAPLPDVDAILLIRGGDADREDAAELADNLVDELREREGATVQVRATSEVWCQESEPMRVGTLVPGHALPMDYFRHREDPERGLTFFCVSPDPGHEHAWGRLKPPNPLR